MGKEIDQKKRFYSTTEVAGLLGISVVAVNKRIKTGKLRAEKIGRNYAIPRSEVAALLGKELRQSDKELINAAVEKTIEEFGTTLKMLAHN